MKINTELSRTLSRLTSAKDRMCYQNAIATLFLLPKSKRGTRYVEGWAVSDLGLVTLHGWVEFRGEILEVTPCWLAMKGVQYFPGRRWAYWEIRRKLRTGLIDLPFCHKRIDMGIVYPGAFLDAYRALLGDKFASMYETMGWHKLREAA